MGVAVGLGHHSCSIHWEVLAFRVILPCVCVQVSCGRGSGSDVVGGDGGKGDERKGVQDSTSL